MVASGVGCGGIVAVVSGSNGFGGSDSVDISNWNFFETTNQERKKKNPKQIRFHFPSGILYSKIPLTRRINKPRSITIQIT